MVVFKVSFDLKFITTCPLSPMMNILAPWIISFINPPWYLTFDCHIFICTSLFCKWLWPLPLFVYLLFPWSSSCLSFPLVSSNDITMVYWWNCYSWYPINLSFQKNTYLLLTSNISFSTKIVYPPTYFTSQLSWSQICSRSSSTHQRCFNSFSSYKTPIDMKSVGLVPGFHGLISFQIQLYSFCIQGDTYELVELLESVNSADLVTFIILYPGI
jgi:hypothetical protein